jgi:hypothetical protein
MRLILGPLMALSIILAFIAIRRHDIEQHRAWMLRGYAIGIGAGTQAVVHIPYFILIGVPDQMMHTILMGAAWGINMAVAEWVIYRQRAQDRARQVNRRSRYSHDLEPASDLLTN